MSGLIKQAESFCNVGTYLPDYTALHLRHRSANLMPQISTNSQLTIVHTCIFLSAITRRSIQKFRNSPPEPTMAASTAFCYYVPSYAYLINQSNESCSHNPLRCFSTAVCCCACYGQSAAYNEEKIICVKVCVKLGKTAPEANETLKTTFGDKSMGRT
jgi:hypothetical protein